MEQVRGRDASKKAFAFLIKKINKQIKIRFCFLLSSWLKHISKCLELRSYLLTLWSKGQMNASGFLAIWENESYCLSHSKMGFLLVSVKSISNDTDLWTGFTKESLRGSERDFCFAYCCVSSIWNSVCHIVDTQ